jgi:hypothetical protein
MRGRILIWVMILVASAGPPAAALAVREPVRPGDPVWLLAAPWTDLDALQHESGLREIGPVRPLIGRIVVAEAPTAHAAARVAGAVALLPARFLSFCGE